jgi:hypothetical protein
MLGSNGGRPYEITSPPHLQVMSLLTRKVYIMNRYSTKGTNSPVGDTHIPLDVGLYWLQPVCA